MGETKTLPSDVRPYRRTPEFSAATVPAGLTRNHRTKAGTWGRIVVLEGRVEYAVERTGMVEVLDADTPGVIEPEVLHRVTPSADARFYVEFLR